ncbi:carboxypeptidase-like regulatory domain-containing protein [Dyadobacter frigoris]|uniref:Carboxypeptidase-like regulatory domain-containing protein n=1 Tax=Dyadobacter frigoris TaxID=2576211 RepID=A0A4U6D7I3_9BACT|nr:carboxypeptidase-like regulatory domain-containing protein [Dyadobacter frigoris]TKT92475.1 hypothetical protein FDK13_10960 [Dyadobacter frigoris]GLU55265.1 hypothetical protein Dfri01_47260 [Dyadobacter frigoris]
MKASSLQLLLAVIACTYSYGDKAHAQELLQKKVTIEAQQRTIRLILSELEVTANVKFVYSKSTDVNGAYTLSVPDEEAILVFSFVGYTSHEVKVGTSSVIDIDLKFNDKSLDEVVVVGYGVQRKSVSELGTYQSEC